METHRHASITRRIYYLCCHKNQMVSVSYFRIIFVTEVKIFYSQPETKLTAFLCVSGTNLVPGVYTCTYLYNMYMYVYMYSTYQVNFVHQYYTKYSRFFSLIVKTAIFEVVEMTPQPTPRPSLKPRCVHKFHTNPTDRLGYHLRHLCVPWNFWFWLPFWWFLVEYKNSILLVLPSEWAHQGMKKPRNHPLKKRAVHQEICVDLSNFWDNFLTVSSNFWRHLMTLLSET